MSNRFFASRSIQLPTGLLVCCFCFSLVATTRGDERTAEQIRAAKAFYYDGVDFSLRQEQFLKQFPNAVRETNPILKTGINQYRARTKTCTYIDVSFREGTIYEVKVFWDKQQLRQVGGDTVIRDKLIAIYGQPDPLDSNRASVAHIKTWVWEIKEAKRSFCLVASEAGASFTVSTISTEDQVPKRIETAKLFNYEGITFSRTQDQFLKQFPNAISATQDRLIYCLLSAPQGQISWIQIMLS
jgi:hypothetical protein